MKLIKLNLLNLIIFLNCLSNLIAYNVTITNKFGKKSLEKKEPDILQMNVKVIKMEDYNKEVNDKLPKWAVISHEKVSAEDIETSIENLEKLSKEKTLLDDVKTIASRTLQKNELLQVENLEYTEFIVNFIPLKFTKKDGFYPLDAVSLIPGGQIILSPQNIRYINQCKATFKVSNPNRKNINFTIDFSHSQNSFSFLSHDKDVKVELIRKGLVRKYIPEEDCPKK